MSSDSQVYLKVSRVISKKYIDALLTSEQYQKADQDQKKFWINMIDKNGNAHIKHISEVYQNIRYYVGKPQLQKKIDQLYQEYIKSFDHLDKLKQPQVSFVPPQPVQELKEEKQETVNPFHIPMFPSSSSSSASSSSHSTSKPLSLEEMLLKDMNQTNETESKENNPSPTSVNKKRKNTVYGNTQKKQKMAPKPRVNKRRSPTALQEEQQQEQDDEQMDQYIEEEKKDDHDEEEDQQQHIRQPRRGKKMKRQILGSDSDSDIDQQHKNVQEFKSSESERAESSSSSSTSSSSQSSQSSQSSYAAHPFEYNSNIPIDSNGMRKIGITNDPQDKCSDARIEDDSLYIKFKLIDEKTKRTEIKCIYFLVLENELKKKQNNQPIILEGGWKLDHRHIKVLRKEIQKRNDLILKRKLEEKKKIDFSKQDISLDDLAKDMNNLALVKDFKRKNPDNPQQNLQ